MTRHPPDDRALEASLQRVYDQVPTLNCRGKCADSCTNTRLPIVGIERRRIQEKTGVDVPDTPQRQCPALSPDGACTVHAWRPLICRLWGTAAAMPCPYGCVPEDGWLTDDALIELMLLVHDISGSDLPTEAIRHAMTNPQVKAAIARMLRGDDSTWLGDADAAR